MPIKLIVNGYYRSGTTFFWSLLNSNSLYTQPYVFYEPLHPRLHLHIEKNKHSKEFSPLHGQRIWNQYNEIPENVILNLLKSHPNTIDSNFISNKKILLDYLKVFDSMDEDIVLQTNRLHFHLDDIAKEYPNIKIIHLVRNPLDVYSSMKKASFKSNKRIKGLIKGLFQSNNVFFDIHKEYKWVSNRLGKDFERFFNWTKRIKRKSVFEKFVVIYILANYYAIKSIENHGKVLTYEMLTNEPNQTSRILSDFLGQEFRIDAGTIIKKAILQEDKNLLKNFNVYADRNRLNKEYSYIKNYVLDNCFVKYS